MLYTEDFSMHHYIRFLQSGHISRNGQEIESITPVDEKSAMDKNQFSLVRLYHQHKGTPEF